MIKVYRNEWCFQEEGKTSYTGQLGLKSNHLNFCFCFLERITTVKHAMMTSSPWRKSNNATVIMVINSFCFFSCIII